MLGVQQHHRCRSLRVLLQQYEQLQQQLPSLLTPNTGKRIVFLHWSALIWIAWATAFAVLALKGARWWARRRRARGQGATASG